MVFIFLSFSPSRARLIVIIPVIDAVASILSACVTQRIPFRQDPAHERKAKLLLVLFCFFFHSRRSNAPRARHASHDLDRKFRPKMVKRGGRGRGESPARRKNQLISISRRPRAREGNFQFVAAPKSEERQKRREARLRICHRRQVTDR